MIKKWAQFIKESVVKIDSKFWTLSEDDIRDFFIDFQHENYIITIEFGIVEIIQQEPSEVFSEKFTIGDYTRPAYWIRIQWNNKTLNNDITDSIEFVYNNIIEKTNGEISLFDEDGSISINNIHFKGGAYLISGSEEYECNDYLALFVKEKKEIEATSKFVADYYSWEADETSGESVYLNLSIEDMADSLLSPKDNYKKYLIEGINDEDYLGGEYQPDIQSLFQYSLNKENEILAIKSLIKEHGGLNELIEMSGNDKLKNLSEEEVIQFLLKERFNVTLKDICEVSEIILEIQQTCGDFETNAHISKNQKDIWNAFIYIVDKEIEDYTIIEKEVAGNMEKFFSIPLNNKWIEDMDSETRFRLDTLYDVYREWEGKMGFNYELNPHFSDYGDVNHVSMNNEIKYILEKYLSGD